MKLHRLISLGLMAGGAAAAIHPLQRRSAWDRANRTAYIALDHDDVVEAAVRAGLPLGDLYHRLWHAGATHVTLREDTLGRLQAQGRLAVAIPQRPLENPAPVGRWSYLAAHEPGLLPRLQAELEARQPQLEPRLLDGEGRSLLAIGGDLLALRDVGLGFDPALADEVRQAGLRPLPRPVSYPWPTRETIDRTLAQAAALATAGDGLPAIVAFEGIGTPGHVGELLLGHEMLMSETIAALRRHDLAFAYFAESRHQRGDWFVAKSLAPAVVSAHEFTQAQLIAEDMYSAAHRWGLLAREEGVRLALLRLFKVVHATAPLDCVDYVAAVAHVLVNREGMPLAGRPDFRPEPVHHDHDHGPSHGHHHHHHYGHEHSHHDDADHEHNHDHHHEHGEHAHAEVGHAVPASFLPLSRDDGALPWLALIPAGAGVLALGDFLGLPERMATPLAVAGLLAPVAVSRLDRPANELEAAFRPSYGPKLIALGTLCLAPLAANLAGRDRGPLGFLQAIAVQGMAAAGLAAAVAEHDYIFQIEEVKTGQLDWIVPLSGALAAAAFPRQAPPAWRLVLAAGAASAGLVAARSGVLPADPLGTLDSEHTAEHTHHLSRAQAALGDARMAISPRPLRKWTVPALLAQAAAALLPGRPGDLASLAAALGGVAFLAGFRKAERPVARTVADRLPGAAGNS